MRPGQSPIPSCTTGASLLFRRPPIRGHGLLLWIHPSSRCNPDTARRPGHPTVYSRPTQHMSDSKGLHPQQGPSPCSSSTNGSLPQRHSPSLSIPELCHHASWLAVIAQTASPVPDSAHSPSRRLESRTGRKARGEREKDWGRMSEGRGLVRPAIETSPLRARSSCVPRRNRLLDCVGEVAGGRRIESATTVEDGPVYRRIFSDGPILAIPDERGRHGNGFSRRRLQASNGDEGSGIER
ncbi:hypothetical protein HMN09_01085100 [Mycena chlorophos]|uniref:Uncharacterized protein n=1 Tax=Mycena chlorophos TaxID=658473 RepID=A0A8H6SBZ4_MYCCL|nr:hypothetical protein HMN09_01085100 [Mycena chlorophos]